LFVRGVTLVSSGPPDRPHSLQISDVAVVYDAVSGDQLEQVSGRSGRNCPLPADGLPDGCGKGRSSAITDGMKE
jgi:hypothetical protein